MLKSSRVREPRWYGIPFRVAFITFLLTLLAFAISLLLGIVGLVVFAKIRGGTPNLAVAYRQIAFPAAMTVAAIVFLSSLIVEVRHYRECKATAELDRMVDDEIVDC